MNILIKWIFKTEQAFFAATIRFFPTLAINQGLLSEWDDSRLTSELNRTTFDEEVCGGPGYNRGHICIWKSHQDKDTPNTKIYGLIRYTRHEYAKFHDWARRHIELFYDQKKQENRKLVEDMFKDYYKFALEIGELVTSVTVTTTVTRN